MIKRILKHYGTDFCWIQIGKSGRREAIYPEISSLVVFKDGRNEKLVDEIGRILREVGFRIDVLECYSLVEWRDAVKSLLAKPDAEKISAYIDGRYLYGDKGIYAEWKNETSKLKDESIARVLANSEKPLSKALLNCLKAIQILGTNGELRREIEEAYSVVMDVETRRSFGNTGKVDEILMKEASKILLKAKEIVLSL
jgi:hypothetical protein